jgi:hypothetical protein
VRRRLILSLCGLVFVALSLVSALTVRAAWTAADLARQAQAELTGARQGDADAVLPALTTAAHLLADAQALLDAPAPSLVASLPVVGRSLQAESAVVRAGGSAVAAARRAATHAEQLTETDGSVDLDVLGRLGRDLATDTGRAERDLRDLRRVGTRGTPPQVGRAVREAVSGLTPVVRSLRRGASGTALAHSLLGNQRPRRVLVALQNNAELRGSGGYVSSYAIGTVAQGQLRLDPFRNVTDVAEPPARVRRVPAPAEFVEDYGPFLADTTLWRTWTMSPDVPAVAQVGAAVAGRLLGVQPDLVLLLDVPALSSLAELAGGVLVDGQRLQGDALTQALLVDAYAQGGLRDEDQAVRRAALQRAAGDAVAGVLGGAGSPLATLQRFDELAAGRHAALWSARAGDARLLRSLRLDGAVEAGTGDLVSVNVNNLNANKLDYYIDRRVDVEVILGRHAARVVQRVRLENSAPPGLVPYVAGFTTPGEAVERVEFSVSPRATIRGATVNGAPAKGLVRRGAGRTRVAATVRVRPASPVEVVLTYDVPVEDGRYQLRLLPQPLARDAHLRVRGTAADGEQLGGPAVPHDGAFAQQGDLDLRLAEPPARAEALSDRLRRWWREPVRLPAVALLPHAQGRSGGAVQMSAGWSMLRGCDRAQRQRDSAHLPAGRLLGASGGSC